MQHQKQMSWQYLDCALSGPASIVSTWPTVFIRPLWFSLAADQKHTFQVQTHCLDIWNYGEGYHERIRRMHKAKRKGHVLLSLQQQDAMLRSVVQRYPPLPHCPSGGQSDASRSTPVCQSPQQAWLNELSLLAVKQRLRENYGIMCSSVQCNLIQWKLVSCQVRNYREKRNCGVCLVGWFKYAASAKISCQMENIGWEVLKKENSPKRRLCATVQNPQVPNLLQGFIWAGLNQILYRS